MKTYKVEEELAVLLEEEAIRIINILLDMYKKKTRVNKSFYLLVDDLMKKEFKFYDVSILSLVISLIPLDLMICPTNEWVFVTEKEYYSAMEEEIINGFEDETGKNEALVKEIADQIIKHYKNDNLNSKNILEIIYHYIPYNDLTSIDSKAISYLIKNIILKISENYQVVSINPFTINGL